MALTPDKPQRKKAKHLRGGGASQKKSGGLETRRTSNADQGLTLTAKLSVAVPLGWTVVAVPQLTAELVDV